MGRRNPRISEGMREASCRSRKPHGGHTLGEIVAHEVPGAGLLTFTCATDPEGNILELQSWR